MSGPVKIEYNPRLASWPLARPRRRSPLRRRSSTLTVAPPLSTVDSGHPRRTRRIADRRPTDCAMACWNVLQLRRRLREHRHPGRWSRLITGGRGHRNGDPHLIWVNGNATLLNSDTHRPYGIESGLGRCYMGRLWRIGFDIEIGGEFRE
jgi:hypothetical protein